MTILQYRTVDSAVNKVREYIKNQEAHHENKHFNRSMTTIMEKYGFYCIIMAKAWGVRFYGSCIVSAFGAIILGHPKRAMAIQAEQAIEKAHGGMRYG
ncbi:MAG: hypothetical protein IPG38_08245 [Chitinophagaceae bacterium]|nr:hypothetical protein [Chitinophagaceae bacterium]